MTADDIAAALPSERPLQPVSNRQFLLAVVTIVVVGWMGYRGFPPQWPGGSDADVVLGTLANRTRFQARFPLVSLAERLEPPGAPWRRSAILWPWSSAAESVPKYANPVDEAMRGGRQALFRRLHDNAYERFVREYGNGIVRGASMYRCHDERTYTFYTQEDSPVPQPDFATDHGPRTRQISFPLSTDLQSLHAASIDDFADPARFGYVRSRTQVSGFQSHRFRAVPQAENWRVQRLELVSLLLHAEPAVYVSDYLPRMEAGRTHPKRPLSAFEADALVALQRGEELVQMETSAQVRLVGAIRSTQQCIVCHGGERGELLGAFSYVLRR